MVPFTLDTVVSAFTFDLDAASDSAPIGDQQTTNASVVLVGQTEANAAVELLRLGLTTTANAVASSPSPMWRSQSGPMRSPCEPPTPPGISGVRLKLLHESVLGIVRLCWLQSATGR